LIFFLDFWEDEDEERIWEEKGRNVKAKKIAKQAKEKAKGGFDLSKMNPAKLKAMANGGRYCKQTTKRY
jgi:hypothetical protein